ncbi:MAG: undecaprenyl-diphosphatase UppP [Chloroflexota bacterium]|nr:undecaprenyl-diphosphatase UppP [Chloroflexota bacterium]
MDLIQALILGIVQGATEFIPVSSSGHLVLVPWLLGWESPGLLFDTMAHWGTLLAVVAYFWQDLRAIVSSVLRDLDHGQPLASSESKLGWMIVLATIPAVVIGFLFKDAFEALFMRPLWVGGFLLVTGFILWTSETLGKRIREIESIGSNDALLIGLAQSLAITPGMSRSGATIGMGLLQGLERPAAARFSFLMMVPIVFGAGLLQLVELTQVGLSGEAGLVLVAGFSTAAITGYAAIAFLLDYLATRSVRAFAVYCWLFGAFSLLVAVGR